ncbi:proclotting enzyme-like [Limulus polyphemus]|uniref:Proclotting enzyme-like n=1 Tax=Limulus polyphemus TaxID=6850 RepID=A0ABM1TLV1_LIMPO|nr:proclotting enzyme-like [Limulus polyphemus]XP_022256857.1 proclotting enzyme-like [Limulus polyphemus]
MTMSNAYTRKGTYRLLFFTILLTLVISRRHGRRNHSASNSEESCSNGNCVNVLKCRKLLLQNQYHLLEQAICGTEGIIPKVCCPISDEVTTETYEPKEPTPPPLTVQPPNLPRRCGWQTVPLRKIIGGHESFVGSWPWIAALYRDKIQRCGGSLVTSRHVITAGHCVVSSGGVRHRINTFTVRLGEHNLLRDDDGATPINFSVNSIRYHNKYNGKVYANDIAILKLDGRVTFTDRIHPICLPYMMLRNEDLTTRDAFAAGWGKTSSNPYIDSYSPVLREIRVAIWKHKHCVEAYNRNETYITETNMCAGYGDGDKNACVGDSGGPLMMTGSDKNFYLVGIVSFGDAKCDAPGFPAVYTRVLSFLNWIALNLV